MRVVTPKQMREIDRIAIEEYGIPGIVLMENAGRSVAAEILKLPGGKQNNVVLLAGKGNNGGDVMVAARHLFNNGLHIKVFLIGECRQAVDDAGINTGILRKMGIPVNKVSAKKDLRELEEALQWGQVVVDGMFGTGLNGEVGGIYLDIMAAVNGSNRTVVSVDIPSGIHGRTGQICGGCIQASMTVTFGHPKSGLLQYPGAEYVGRLIVADISIPAGIVSGIEPVMRLLDKEYLSEIIPGRRPDTHKGSYGRALIIGGSEGMTGAVVLAALGCLKSGAGLVKTALPGGLNYVMESRLTEAISVPLGKGTGLKIDSQTQCRLAEALSWANAVALGPGMGVGDERAEFLEFVLAAAKTPLVLDADALNCLALDLRMLDRASGPVIITPHPGEMARLVGMDTAEIQKDRISAARAFSEKWGTVTVLKGANTVIADPEGNIYINTSGNPGMSTGGSGDVLTGMIASFTAQGIEPVKAACAAVYIHGRAADLLAGEMGMYGITASELARCIPMAIKEVKKG